MFHEDEEKRWLKILSNSNDARPMSGRPMTQAESDLVTAWAKQQDEIYRLKAQAKELEAELDRANVLYLATCDERNALQSAVDELTETPDGFLQHKFVIAIPDNAIQLTEMGLIHTITKIPGQIRRAFTGMKLSYAWLGECRIETGQRFVLVRVEVHDDGFR